MLPSIKYKDQTKTTISFLEQAMKSIKNQTTAQTCFADTTITLIKLLFTSILKTLASSIQERNCYLKTQLILKAPASN